MTNTPATSCSYDLVITQADEGAECSVVRRGPANALAVTGGRSCDEGIRLAGLLFPICPRAHMAAGLSAMEAAAGVMLSSEQAAAREAAVLAEAAASSLWRAGFTWPQLMGLAPDPGLVRSGRQASDGILAALFSENWARPGGAEIVFRANDARAALNVLTECAEQLETASAEIVSAADRTFDQAFTVLPALGNQLLFADTAPDRISAEETPRSQARAAQTAGTLSDWFAAQAAATRALTGQLADALDRIAPAPAANFPSDATGTGMGIATTARGRLRHIIDLDHGRIARWTSTAPTDWNFALNGPAANYAAQLARDEFDRIAPWLIAALDPCSPCRIVPAGSAAHA
ncbi:MAG: hypothetical protein R3C13_10595 [Hyphomonas sp.]|uniref:hypothetical protein n=1 Tax=Hyphomonas sp. TaxID=87 RepID=UPI0035285BC4